MKNPKTRVEIMLKGLRKKASILLITSTTLSNLGDDYGLILKEVHDFEVALKAMDYLLDDRSPEGTDLLRRKLQEHKIQGSEQPAGIFHLALGVMEFLEATLGFEPEVMAKAHTTLSEAENASVNNAKFNVKHNLVTSHIYPPGTEFQVTHAESTLLNALVMLLQENNGVVESAKALYKLRKAYHTLDSVYRKIKELEPTFNKHLAKLKKQTASKSSSLSSVDLPGYDESKSNSSASLPQDMKLMKDLEQVFQMRKSRIEGTNLGNTVDPKSVNLFANISANSSSITLSRQGSVLNEKVRGISPRPDTNLVFKADTPTPPTVEITNDSLKSFGDEEDIGNVEMEDEESDEEFSDAFESLDNIQLQPPTPTIPSPNLSSQYLEDSNISLLTESSAEKNDTYLHVSTIDEFIHSGVQLCFGILQVVLSLIPPAIGRVLSIVGFRGERDVGLKLLWRNAITCRNIHGDLALLCLLVFYDGPVQFVDQGFQLPKDSNSNVSNIIDISARNSISDEELDKVLLNPDFYTPQLLDKVIKFFPHNALWILQQGRVLSSHGKLTEAIKLMQDFTDDPNNKIQMQQSESLLVFDRATFYAFNHQFDEAAEDLLKLINLSSWCRSLYILMAGSCYVAKYRMIKMDLIKYSTEQEKAKQLEKYAKLAEKYIKLAPTYIPGYGSNATGRKGGIGGGNKQLPFDKFVLRKSKQIEERANANPELPFVDIIGTSIVHELIYFWNGYNRMDKDNLELSLKILGYSGEPNTEYSVNNDNINYAKIPETEDESMIRYFAQAVCLRSLGKLKEGLSLLDSKVISKYVVLDLPFKFNRVTYSPYLSPTALYEKTMFVWLIKTNTTDLDVKKCVVETKEWLKKASMISDVGDYELSNRTNMRIKAASEKLDQIGERN